MGDVHSGIVNNDTEVVSRPTVGSHYYQIIELGIFKNDPPLNMVIYNCLALKRHLESDCRMFSWNMLFKFPASAVVFRDTLMDRHHYLGFRVIVGESLRYVAFLGKRPVALIGWGAAAFKSRHRDAWIGWEAHLKWRRLCFIANNIRFLILPKVAA